MSVQKPTPSMPSPRSTAPASPPTAKPAVAVTRRRRVSYLRFIRPVLVPRVGFVTEMNADTRLNVDRPGGAGIGTPIPQIWLCEDGSFLVGNRQYPVQIVESWELSE